MPICAMMDWDMWGMPHAGLWMLILWLVLAVIGVVVYFDAQKRGMNGVLWLVLMLIPMFAIAALIIYLVLREGGGTVRSGGKSAGMLLDERYARGEISRDEYLRMKDDITQKKAV